MKLSSYKIQEQNADITPPVKKNQSINYNTLINLTKNNQGVTK